MVCESGFILDVSLTDLEQFEEEMIKIITAFINTKSVKDGHVDLAYLDEMRYRTSNKKGTLVI